MRNIKLEENNEIPILGLGTWQLKGDDCYKSVRYALDLGYTHIDTAEVYDNHNQVGKAIADSDINREDLFITSKLWRTDFAKDDVEQALDKALNDLDLEYLDLYLMHWPNKNIDLEETLGKLHRMKEIGKIKSYGVSNFTKNHIKDVLDTEFEVVNNQVEFHPTLYQKELLEFCQVNDIQLTAYSPIGRTEDLDNEVIVQVAEKNDCTPAQVILNWHMAKDIIVIPKASSEEHIKENLETLEIDIPSEDLEKLDKLDNDNRLVVPDFHEFDY
jgi:diketogulonate reductase-like aldo/keto reductase